MNAKNITPFVSWSLLLVWVVAVSVVGTMLVPAWWVIVPQLLIGCGGGVGILAFFEGDRLWITDGNRLPIGFMWKPRGYRSVKRMKGTDVRGTEDNSTLDCRGCGEEFDAAYNHFRNDIEHYCPDCSNMGEMVMKNYQEWFTTSADMGDENT